MKAAPTAEQIARLPKWARDYVETLERQTVDAQRERDEARFATKPEDSDAILDPYGDPAIGLGKRPTVRFPADGPVGLPKISGWDWIDVAPKTDVVTGRRYVEVRGGTGVVVEPQASNSLRVYLSR